MDDEVFETNGLGEPESSVSSPPAFRLSLDSHTQNADPNNYQIVLYNDRKIVAYNASANQFGALALTPAEEATITQHWMVNCPLCGHSVNPRRLTYQSEAYFRILQHILQRNARRPRHRHYAPPTQFNDRQAEGNTPALIDTRDRKATESSSPFGTSPKTSSKESLSAGARNVYSNHKVHQPETAEKRQRQDQWAVVQEPEPSKPKAYSTKHSVDILPPNEDASDDEVHSLNPFHPDFSSLDSPEDEIPAPKNISRSLFVTGYYKRFFIEEKKLGSGSYGRVFLCTHVLNDLTLGQYAVKKLPIGDNSEWFLKIMTEVKVRERIHHPNIIEYKHSWLEMHRSNTLCPWVPWIFVLMEFCNGGTLEDFLWAQGPSQLPFLYLEDLQVWKIFLDILFGLQTLHHAGVLHRDLKFANILWDYSIDNYTKRQSFRCVLSDFGTAEVLGRPSGQRQGYTGTVQYTAPELLETDEIGRYRELYDVKTDMWSAGIVLYGLCYGRLPFGSDDPKECREEITKSRGVTLPEKPFRSKGLQMLILALLSKDPVERPTTDDILTNPIMCRILADKVTLQQVSETLAMKGLAMIKSRGGPVPEFSGDGKAQSSECQQLQNYRGNLQIVKSAGQVAANSFPSAIRLSPSSVSRITSRQDPRF